MLAFTLFVGLAAGALLVVLAAWSVDGSVTTGVAAGAATGGAFAVVPGAVLLAAGRQERRAVPSAGTR